MKIPNIWFGNLISKPNKLIVLKSSRSNWNLYNIHGNPRCPPPLMPLPGQRDYQIGIFTSWWLNQPIWKICSSNWKSSPIFGVRIKNIWNLVYDINWFSDFGFLNHQLYFPHTHTHPMAQPLLHGISQELLFRWREFLKAVHGMAGQP